MSNRSFENKTALGFDFNSLPTEGSFDSPSRQFGLSIGVEAFNFDGSQVTSSELMSSAFDSPTVTVPMDFPFASTEPKSSVFGSVTDTPEIKREWHRRDRPAIASLEELEELPHGQSGVVTAKATPVSYLRPLRKNKMTSKEVDDFKREFGTYSVRTKRELRMWNQVNQTSTVNLEEVEESPSGQPGVITEKATSKSLYLSALQKNKMSSKEMDDFSRELALEFKRIKKKRKSAAKEGTF